MDFRRLNIENISIEEMNKHLQKVQKYYEVVERPRERFEAPTVANLEVGRLHINLTYRDGKTVTYHARFDNKIDDDSILPLTSYTTMCKYYQVPKFNGREDLGYDTFELNGKQKVSWNIASTTQFIWFNNNYNEKWNENCRGYDVNSSFSYAMLKPMPDTSQEIIWDGVVKKGEQIGFNYDGDVIEEGPASIIFPLMPSPFKPFVDKWYGFKKKATSERDKQYAKGMLNFCIGWLQRVNPFLRNTIVYYSNKHIREYACNEDGTMRDDVIYCNTDCIISLIPRYDIECNIGEELGQWKFEHCGKFAFSDYSTQWEGEIPKYRGVSKCLFEEYIKDNGDYDLTEDTIPDDTYFPYRMDYGFKEINGKIFPTYKIIKNRS